VTTSAARLAVGAACAFAPGDVIRVHGSDFEVTSVHKGGKTLRVRDDRGETKYKNARDAEVVR